MSYPIYVNTDYIVDKDYRTTPLNTVAVFQINSTTGVSFENAYRVYGAGGSSDYYGENSIYIPDNNKITTLTNTGILAGGGAGGSGGYTCSNNNKNGGAGGSGGGGGGSGGCGGGGGGGAYISSNGSCYNGQNGTNGNDYGYGIGGLGGNNGAGGNGGNSGTSGSGAGGGGGSGGGDGANNAASGGWGIMNYGSIDTLRNLQGGVKNGNNIFPLYLRTYYGGTIPSNYYIIIDDNTGQFGQLLGSYTGITNFGIDSTSILNISKGQSKFYYNVIKNGSTKNTSGTVVINNVNYEWILFGQDLQISNPETTDVATTQDYTNTSINTSAFIINSLSGISFTNSYSIYGGGGSGGCCLSGKNINGDDGQNALYIPKDNNITILTNTGIMCGGGGGGGCSTFNSGGDGGAGGGGGEGGGKKNGNNGSKGNKNGIGIGGKGGTGGDGGNSGDNGSNGTSCKKYNNGGGGGGSGGRKGGINGCFGSGIGGSGGYGIKNNGSINTISNLQGGVKNGKPIFPLYLNGQIPKNYNIIINDLTGQYGQLIVINIDRDTTNFNIDPTSIINPIKCKPKIYLNVINNDNYISYRLGTFTSGDNTYVWEIADRNLIITNPEYKCKKNKCTKI
jgi:hypothetical protein